MVVENMEIAEKEKPVLKTKFTQQQWMTIIVLGLANIFNSVCISLQAPFYPMEAAKRGATASEFGFVFGVYELVGFIVAPFFGQYLNVIGPKRLFYSGILLGGIACMLFGSLDLIMDRTLFIVFSFVFRIIEALGNNGFMTASFAITAKIFPQNVATIFAVMETVWGFGFFLGPWIGAKLYEINGFYLPFVVVGIALLITALVARCILPKKLAVSEENKSQKLSMLKVIRIPEIFVSSFGLISMSTAVGFLSATLEPHLRLFNFTPTQVGYFFVLHGCLYAIGAPMVGLLIDKFLNAKVCAMVGCILSAIGFCFIGPISFMPYDTEIWSIVVGLIFNGVAFACVYVACFTDALRTCVRVGLPDDLNTYGLISGLFISNYALGSFIGPSVGGILFDLIGFNHGSYFIFVTQLMVAMMFLILIIHLRRASRSKSDIPVADDAVK